MKEIMPESRKDSIHSLAEQAQIFCLHEDASLPSSHQAVLDLANKSKRLLAENELIVLCEKSGCDPQKLVELEKQLPNLVDKAKEDLLKKKPAITAPGGSLYPNDRAEACWRDCFHFARISIYGTAAGNVNITDKKGLEALRELYLLLEVPLEALIICLEQLQNRCGELLSQLGANKDEKLLRGCFQHLNEKITSFQSKNTSKDQEST